ncbi:hypothetical protein GQ43DRAFT_364234 [Delitschia confertaspora ATCC 74209]|uniref:Uncharacterized protein n=1 Tax=Delitschia confertaspora ATCC 74209 TaxID=1513339 RepID=A0A9P4JWB1_9PLEO|nr:hypothetical protein GQ43DRAFT_364234 [Delitschia confertaspora ATCC 74209]
MKASQLELIRSSAFESEHARLFDSSYMQHEAAAQGLEQLIENSLVSISPDENSDEDRRIARTQIWIHRERQKALRPHLESGSGMEDEEGRRVEFVPAPMHWGANGDLDEESGSLSSVQNFLTWQASYSPLSHPPLYEEIAPPDMPYADMLDPTAPPTTYHLHRTREWSTSGSRRYIYSAREYSDKYSLYMLECAQRGDTQITSAEFYRVAEFPTPCISILLSGIEKKAKAASDAYKSRSIQLRGPFSQPIKEYPDRSHKIPWSPRRFTYGGRRFVWKPGDENDDLMPETLYEYTRDWAKPGSRTGKRLDDARPRKLVWGERPKAGRVVAPYTIHFAGGIDQVFRECLLASQMVRQVCLFTAME